MSERHRLDAFTDRELALLEAWDEQNAPSSDAAFEARLLAAYARAEEASLRADEARDAAICRQLAAGAEFDDTVVDGGADRGWSARGRTVGSSAAIVAAAPFEEVLRDDVAARRRAWRWACGSVAAAVAAAMVAAVLWPLDDTDRSAPGYAVVERPTEMMPGGMTQGALSPDLVATMVRANVEGAQVEIEGTDQAGPSPFAARLRQGRPYVARVSAPGFEPRELEVVGGNDVPAVELVASGRVRTVERQPASALARALAAVVTARTGDTTPPDVLGGHPPPLPPTSPAADLPGFITIDASPDYAVIYIDGKSYGESPLVRLELPPGRHLVHAVSPSGATHDVRISIKPGKVAPAVRIVW